MSENLENKEALEVAKNEEIESDFSANFVPKVHKIGIATHAAVLVFSLAPLVYFLFIKGYRLDSPVPYVTLLLITMPGAIAFYLTEALGYWPMLGSAGVYMTYLAGNSGSMRVPVATAAQNAMDAPITTARGQVVTIIAVATSVVLNLIILLGVVLFGSFLVGIIPPAVKAAFGFVSVSVFSTILTMRLTATGSFKGGVSYYWPQILIGVGVFLFRKFVMPSVTQWAPFIAVVLSMTLGYFLFQKEQKKEAEKQSNAAA